MMIKNVAWRAVAAGCVFLGLQSSSHAVDSASLEFGTGNKTQMVRFGAQWKWDRQWWQSNGTHIGGYWDLTLSQWRGNRFQNVPGNTQNITDLGFTPVFRFQRDSLKGPYLEAGIGAHYLSGLYDNNGRRLSTNFQFGDHLGVGYVFPNNLDLGLKFQHFSNGGIKSPNNGVNFAVVRISYPF
jgi:lipid A 3-O-deacylase